MPRLVICSRDLHGHMVVLMLCLTWLTIAQHVFQPAWTCRLEFISRKIVSCEPRTNFNKGYHGEQISQKIVSRELGPRSYRDFAKNIVLFSTKKMGSNIATATNDLASEIIIFPTVSRWEALQAATAE